MFKIFFFLFLMIPLNPLKAVLLEDIVAKGMLEETLKGKTIGYYVGSFDPFHLGHLEVADEALRSGNCDYVLIAPVWGGDPYKKRTEIKHRLKMLEAAFKDHPQILITHLPPQDFQQLLTQEENRIIIGKPAVKVRFEGAQFVGIIGSDVALEMGLPAEESKKEKERLKKLSAFMRGVKLDETHSKDTIGGIMALPVDSFLVSLRQGDNLSPLEGYVENRPILRVLTPRKYSDLSSTKIKQALKERKPVEDMLHPQVLKIIQQEKLYS